MRELVDRAVIYHGGLDVLVTSAGIQRYGTVEETSEQLWYEVLGVNLTGVFLAAQAAVPALRERAVGRSWRSPRCRRSCRSRAWPRTPPARPA